MEDDLQHYNGIHNGPSGHYEYLEMLYGLALCSKHS